MEIQASLTKTAKRKDKERLERKEEERDVFREIPLRYLGKPMKDEQVIFYGSKHFMRYLSPPPPQAMPTRWERLFATPFP